MRGDIFTECDLNQLIDNHYINSNDVTSVFFKTSSIKPNKKDPVEAPKLVNSSLIMDNTGERILNYYNKQFLNSNGGNRIKL